ncbi:MAG: SPOR domain-containing protein [Flavobacteriales bacterium]|nr:MAG: SPOR domain-containing protein [Flavobacteriales bacterium]
MSIDQRIRELLFDHDCVIVPEFGGFLVQYKGARIDEARRLVHPPSKEVGFNKQLTRNDGLLVDSVAKQDDVRFEQARTQVAQQVEQWQRTLGHGGRVEVSGVGTFWTDTARNLRFEPDPHANFLKDAFGLRAVAASPIAKPVVVETLKEAVVRKLEPVLADEGTSASRNRPLLWAASAAAAVLVAVATFVLTPTTGNEQLGGWASWLQREAPGYVQRGTTPVIVEESGDENFSLPETLDSAVTVDVEPGVELVVAPIVLPDTTHVAVTPVTPRAKGLYHVMAGCFSVRGNADNLVAGLRGRGFDAGIIDQHRGLWRVAIGSFADERIAVEALVAARKEEAPGAWILHK